MSQSTLLDQNLTTADFLVLLDADVENKRPAFAGLFGGGASRTRTGDLLGAIQALSQLSYSPERAKCSRAYGEAGVAAPVPRFSFRRPERIVPGMSFDSSR